MGDFWGGDEAVVFQAEISEGSCHGEAGAILIGHPNSVHVRLLFHRQNSASAAVDSLLLSWKIRFQIHRELLGNEFVAGIPCAQNGARVAQIGDHQVSTLRCMQFQFQFQFLYVPTLTRGDGGIQRFVPS